MEDDMARTALMTGGTRGPGRAIALALRDGGFVTGAAFDVNGGRDLA